MKRYYVWIVGTNIANAKIIMAKSSLEARQCCAAAWGRELDQVIARAA